LPVEVGEALVAYLSGGRCVDRCPEEVSDGLCKT